MLDVAKPYIGGQAEVVATDFPNVCGGWGNTDQYVQNGGALFHNIRDPVTNQSFHIQSQQGKNLLKSYIKHFKNIQSGGVAPVGNGNATAAHPPVSDVQVHTPDMCQRDFNYPTMDKGVWQPKNV